MVRISKMAAFLLILAIAFQSFGFAAQAQSIGAITIQLNGRTLATDSPPYIVPKANVTMVPIRVVSDGLNAVADWTAQTKTATITGADHVLKLTSGKKTAVVDGNAVALDATVEIKQGRVMVPLRFVGENLGLLVDWNAATRVITLTSVASGSAGGLRAAWVSTVYNLDWPSKNSLGDIAKQQADYRTLLDQLQSMGLNAVFVQVRSAADALYPSKLVPWSASLTGVQGMDPGYDPLAFMISETHKRGMQFHAWFNPFRAKIPNGSLAANNVAVQHPEWIVDAGSQSYINPGIPEARQSVIDDIMEVVKGYDIDGVHLDDYFYPSGVVFNDDAAFAQYNDKAFARKADWRRDNINMFVQQLSQSIHSVKPNVQFGISPFGVWRNKADDPTGSDTTASITSYDSMFADTRTWIRQGWIDYIAPQVYWSLSYPNARYDKLVDWWANETAGTNVKLYIGHAPYKLGTSEAGWQSADEIINQLKYDANQPEVQGDIFFSAKDLLKNPLGLIQSLQAYYVPG